MFDPKFSRKNMSDAIARGVRSAEELPFGGSPPGDEMDPRARARHEAVRRAVLEHLRLTRIAGPARLVAADDVGLSRSADSAGALSIPCMHLAGPPVERARQAGELLAPVLAGLLDEFLAQAAPSAVARWGMGAFLQAAAHRAPPELREEIRALAGAAGVAPARALALTLMGDLHAAMGCSTIVVQPPMARRGEIVFGRNLDFVGYGLSDVAALLTVHHPEPGGAELPHASLGWVGLWGVHTGWNAAGLCLGNMQVYNPAPDSPSGPLQMLSGRTPTSWAYAHLLRRCRTVGEALVAIEKIEPLSPTNLMLADAEGDSALVEWDVRRHRVRRPEGGRLFATNYFIHPDTRGEAVECWRMDLLERTFDARESASQTEGADSPVAADEMKVLLDQVNQGDLTLHSVVFEPSLVRVHLSAGGQPPSTRGRWDSIPWDVWRKREETRDFP